VLPAVEFNDDSPLETNEVHNELTNRCLPAKLAAAHLTMPEPRPQQALGVRHVSSQVASEVVVHGCL
jgi:hypothetical protein